MSRAPLPEFIAIFDDLPDPRISRTKRHRLIDMVTIALCAVIQWVAMPGAVVTIDATALFDVLTVLDTVIEHMFLSSRTSC